MRKTVLSFMLALLSFVSIAFVSCVHNASDDSESDSLAAADSLSGCDTIAVETQKDSMLNKYAEVSVTLSLPVGSGVAQTIRQSLLSIMDTQIYRDADYSGDGSVKGTPYKGDTQNLKAMCEFYCKNIFRQVAKESKQEYDETLQYIDSDPSSTAEQRKEFCDNYTIFEQDIELTKFCEDRNYVVFYDMTYGSRGGAHGGIGGYGYLVYDKTTGRQVQSILKPHVAKQMQRLIKDGLKQYFQENSEPVRSDKELMESLMLPDGATIIPLPQYHGVTPTPDGLLFVYSQYEIACYAMGMPSFVIPYDKVKPYMTDEALRLLQ